MIIDVTGITLTPGNKGKECLGNGNFDEIYKFPNNFSERDCQNKKNVLL